MWTASCWSQPGGYKWSAENAEAIASGPPVVCVDRLPEVLNTDSVCVDDSGAAKLGVKQLLSLGHRRIAIITGDAESINNRFNLLDFVGLFSGAALEPPHSYALRRATTF